MEPKRYFINNLPDDAALPVDVNVQKQRIQGLLNSIIQSFTFEPRNAEGGIYVGLGGVSYVFYHLSKIKSFESQTKQYLEYAQKYIEAALNLTARSKYPKHVTDKTGFMTGNLGLYVVASVIYKKLGMSKECEENIKFFKETGQLVKPLHWFHQGGDELFVGRAGFLCGLLWMRKELQSEIIPESEVREILNTMIESGKQYSKAVRSPLPLMYHYYGTEYLGPAHGVSGILFIMLCFPRWLEQNPEHRTVIQASIDSLLELQSPAGNFPCAMDEVGGRRPEAEELVHWCHGAPGVIYLLAKAYQVFNEQRYLEAALKCGEITWQKGLLKKGPGICHGIAGNGYVFLILYQLTHDPKQLNRASQFMNFIYSHDFARARTPDSPLSLFEGVAGTVCFAADLTDPLTANYPFFSIV